MRLISQHIERKTGEGRAVLLPEEPEDLVTPDDSPNPGGLTDDQTVARLQPDPPQRPAPRLRHPQSNQ